MIATKEKPFDLDEVIPLVIRVPRCKHCGAKSVQCQQTIDNRRRYKCLSPACGKTFHAVAV